MTDRPPVRTARHRVGCCGRREVNMSCSSIVMPGCSNTTLNALGRPLLRRRSGVIAGCDPCRRRCNGIIAQPARCCQGANRRRQSSSSKTTLADCLGVSRMRLYFLDVVPSKGVPDFYRELHFAEIRADGLVTRSSFLCVLPVAAVIPPLQTVNPHRSSPSEGVGRALAGGNNCWSSHRHWPKATWTSQSVRPTAPRLFRSQVGLSVNADFELLASARRQSRCRRHQIRPQ